MDNPWANGWSDESPNPALNDPKPIISSPSWTDSVAGEESDLASPSWSAGADVKWPEPSETQGSLWSHNFDSVHLDAWGSSTYKGISLERPSPHPPSPQEQAEQEKDSPTSSPMQQDVVPSSPKEVTITPPRGPSPALESPHLFASPEVFGSFETAANTRDTRDDDPWSSPISTFPLDTEEVEQWGSEWTAPKADEEESTEDELPDEWEVARQRKENMDQQVVRILKNLFDIDIDVHCSLQSYLRQSFRNAKRPRVTYGQIRELSRTRTKTTTNIIDTVEWRESRVCE